MKEDIPARATIEAMSGSEYKVLENRLRQAANRQGLRLEKSRVRDPRAIGHGTYQLIDAATDTVVLADHNRGYGHDLHDVAEHLFGDRR